METKGVKRSGDFSSDKRITRLYIESEIRKDLFK